jgi:hypothetical protein
MSPAKPISKRRLSVSALTLSALLLSPLPLLAGCAGGGTENQVLLDHSGANMDSPYRHHSHGSHR